MIEKNEWLVIGLITSCHGIRGQVKVKSLSDFDERFTKQGTRWLQKKNEDPKKIELTSGFKQPGKETFVIKIKGINTRDHAEQLKNYQILVKTNELPKLQQEEFHLLELINLQVKTLENDQLKIIGKVINLENERNNLLVIELFKNQKKVFIPFVKEIVPSVDIKNNFLIINPPKGLLDLEI
jgi:16S rRNA processing protein RimM